MIFNFRDLIVFNLIDYLTKEVRKEIKIIPAQVKVVEHVTYIYACRNCEKNDIEATILKAKKEFLEIVTEQLPDAA